MRRSRLSRKQQSTKRDRLTRAIYNEVRTFSDKEIQSFINAKPEVMKIDPIVKAYHVASVGEQKRRKELSKVYGEARPVVLSGKKAIIAETSYEFQKDFKILSKFWLDALKGKFADDIIEATNYVYDKAEEFAKRGAKDKERWEFALKAHGFMKKNENDFLKEGWTLKYRLPHTIPPQLLSGHLAKQKSLGNQALLIPVKIDNKRYYSMLVKSTK